MKVIIYLFLFVFASGLIAQEKVKTHEGVRIGGIKQWIGAISNDDSKPLLLFLHGGPGFSSLAYSKSFIRRLKNDFIIAQWDQRGAGITDAWNPDSDTLSIGLMHKDTGEVIDYLLTKFDKKKLYLVGFSWGGFLGFQYAANHPEKLHAYVAVSAMVNGDASEEYTLNFLKKKAIDEGNKIASEELSEVEIPFDSWESLYYQRKWTAAFSNAKANKKTYPKSLFQNWSVKWMPVFLNASSVNYADSLVQFDCPVYLFISNKDLVANHEISKQYFQKLRSDKKEIIWFTESTHEIPSQEPKKFSEELIRIAKEI